YIWKKTNWNKFVKIILTILILFFVMIVSLDSNNETSELKSEQTEKEDVLNTTNYEIVEEEDISHALARRYSVRVVVNNNPATKNQIKAISEKTVNDYKAKNADALAIFFYFDKGQIDGAYTLAKAEWAPNGDWSQAELGKDQKLTYKFTDFIDKERIEENLFGLSEEQRKEIFKEIVKCEDWGYREAMRYYHIGCEACPEFIEVDIYKEIDKERELSNDCKEKIDIDKEIMSKISTEGVVKIWTMPKSPSVPDCCK
ncbi:MAG: hypothetical protein KAS78_02600, partial [Candidatus Pacebacteria bacterium]|nr:hypothetical protein [Candidatus Paceibacterota bacterium]